MKANSSSGVSGVRFTLASLSLPTLVSPHDFVVDLCREEPAMLLTQPGLASSFPL